MIIARFFVLASGFCDLFEVYSYLDVFFGAGVGLEGVLEVFGGFYAGV